MCVCEPQTGAPPGVGLTKVLQKAAASRDNTHASLGSNTRSAYTENNLAACWKYDLCESLPVMHCAREKDLLLIR